MMSLKIVRFGSMAMGLAFGLSNGLTAAPADLNPVTFHPAPDHAPVVLVRDGAPLGVIVAPVELTRLTRGALNDLRDLIERTTGAVLPVVAELPAEGPAIVLAVGGEDARDLAVEGFSIRTAPHRIQITGADDHGLTWGIYEFLERFVNVRFYWPEYRDDIGTAGVSIVASDTLSIGPVQLSDAPVFRKRHRWPSGGPRIGAARMADHDRRLRSATTWPIDLIVHAPHGWDALYREPRPEIFQQRRDGGRDFGMLCYGNPMTLQSYLEEIEYQLAAEEPVSRGRGIIRDQAITVSPADMDVSCRCDDCRALWNDDGGAYGTASRVMGAFVAALGRAVEVRWPDMTLIYLPYKNYTYAPEGIEFPGNVEVQICGMPGLALYKDERIRAAEQTNIDAWIALTGRRIQNWHYSCWPADRTDAAYLFPYTAQRHYQDNRDKTVGTFINGVGDHWPRQHLSLYVWLKALWNPDIDVDAVIAEYIRRMYGPAAPPMRDLIGMLIDGWENVEWDTPALSPATVYEQSYPRENVQRMEAWLEQAFAAAADDDSVTRRLNYYAPSLRAFFEESRMISEGEGIQPFFIYQVGDDPVLDGNLDKDVWADIDPAHFVSVRDKQTPRFPTSVKAVWSHRGVTFGFRMHEPEPENLMNDIGKDSRNASLLWWNDNVEIFIDPSGTRSGYFQFIVNPNGAIYDGRGRDTSWNATAVETAGHIGEDFWSLEVFIPYSVFADDEMTPPGTGVIWHGNFTRHRVTQAGTIGGSNGAAREYQGFNVTTGNPSHNQNAFGPFRFIER